MNSWICAVFFLVIIGAESKKDYINKYAIGFMHMGSRQQSIVGQSKILVSSLGDAVFETMKTRNYSKFWNTGGKHVWKYDFDPFSERASLSGQAQTRGAVVGSDQDICIHGFSSDYHSYGGFRAEKLTPNSTEFYLPSYSVKKANSVFIIVAAEDNTVVSISFRERTTGKYSDPAKISLKTYQIYQLLKYGWDITGTYVTSNKPIAVYSGVDCGQVPVGVDFCDNMVIGVPPVANLGTQFIMAPIEDRRANTGYVFRVVATEDGTAVRVYDDFDENSGREQVLSRGAYLEENYNGTITAKVTCSSRCLVLQYNKGHSVDLAKSDPFMLNVPPVEEFSEKLMWSVPEDRHGLPMYSFANIVVPEGKEDGVLLDGQRIVPKGARKWKKVPGGGFSTISHWVYAGPHSMEHLESGVMMGAMIYGHGIHENIAYGYPACNAGSRFLPREGLKFTDVYTWMCTNFTYNTAEGTLVVTEEGAMDWNDTGTKQDMMLKLTGAYKLMCLNKNDQANTNDRVNVADKVNTDQANTTDKGNVADKVNTDKAKTSPVISKKAADNTALYQFLCVLGGIIIGVLLTLLIIAAIWRFRKSNGLAGFSFAKFNNKEDDKIVFKNQQVQATSDA